MRSTGASVSYGYDANGNQVSRGADTFEWDHENRLTETEIDSTTWTHEYNGDGVRMSRGNGTTTVDYVWDVVGGLPMLLQDGINTYIYGLGLVSTYAGSDMSYHQVDGLGSTTNLADEDGDLIGEYTYDAYGNVREHSGAETEFSFAGEQNDPNGLDYLRARYYDPEIGRFLSTDPLGGGYPYAGNNPTSYVDPTGLSEARVDVCTHWRDGNCAGTMSLPARYSGLYIAANSVERWYPPESLGAQTTTPSDAIFASEVVKATQINPPSTGEGGFRPVRSACLVQDVDMRTGQPARRLPRTLCARRNVRRALILSRKPFVLMKRDLATSRLCAI